MSNNLITICLDLPYVMIMINREMISSKYGLFCGVVIRPEFRKFPCMITVFLLELLSDQSLGNSGFYFVC